MRTAGEAVGDFLIREESEFHRLCLLDMGTHQRLVAAFETYAAERTVALRTALREIVAHWERDNEGYSVTRVALPHALLEQARALLAEPHQP